MGERIYNRSIRAMKDADEIIERVLFLEAQLYQIDKMGMQNYIQLMAGKGGVDPCKATRTS